MIGYIALFFSLVSVVLLSIILIKFKKLFSSEKLIEKTQIYMNKRIKEMDNYALRDIELLRENSANIQNQLKQADLVMKKYQEASDRLKNLIYKAERSENRDFFENSETMDNTNFLQQSIIKNQEFENKNYSNYGFDKPFVVKENKDKSGFGNLFTNSNNRLKNKSINESVRKYKLQGYSAEEIAEVLGCSISEVQIVIDLEM